MIEDIVTQITNDIAFRLRAQHGAFRAIVGVNQTVIIDTLYSEAADEIESLRKQVRQLEAERDQWQTRAVSND